MITINQINEAGDTIKEISLPMFNSYELLLINIKQYFFDSFELFIITKENEKKIILSQQDFLPEYDKYYIQKINKNASKLSAYSQIMDKLSESKQDIYNENFCCQICGERIKNENPFFCYNCQYIICQNCLKNLDEKYKPLKCPKCKIERPFDKWETIKNFIGDQQRELELLNTINKLKLKENDYKIIMNIKDNEINKQKNEIQDKKRKIEKLQKIIKNLENKNIIKDNEINQYLKEIKEKTKIIEEFQNTIQNLENNILINNNAMYKNILNNNYKNENNININVSNDNINVDKSNENINNISKNCESNTNINLKQKNGSNINIKSIDLGFIKQVNSFEIKEKCIICNKNYKKNQFNMCPKCLCNEIINQTYILYIDFKKKKPNIKFKLPDILINGKKYSCKNLIDEYNNITNDKNNLLDENKLFKLIQQKICIYCNKDTENSKFVFPCGCSLCKKEINNYFKYKKPFNVQTHFICVCGVEYSRFQILLLGISLEELGENFSVLNTIIQYLNIRLDSYCCICGNRRAADIKNTRIYIQNSPSSRIGDSEGCKKFLSHLIHHICANCVFSYKPPLCFKCTLCTINHDFIK